jgi:arginyl-tRNA synthetase
MTAAPTLRHRLNLALERAASEAGVEGPVPDLEVVRAKSLEFGDFASSSGMKLARVLRKPPPAIAAELAARVRAPEATAEAAGGYVNFRLRPEWLRQLVGEVAQAGRNYGASEVGGGEKVQVEHLSVNPTGPLHIGHGRGAILGDALANLLALTGHSVEREYYVNDYGTQAHKFGASILARLRGEEPPEGGYVGDYINEIADAAREKGVPETEEDLMQFGLGLMVERFKAVLERIRVRYDTWFSEKTLWTGGTAEEAIAILRARGFLKDKDGAVWFGPALGEEGGEEEDRVVFRSNGQHTYFASDLGYLLSRFSKRGFHRVIEVWGSDHHGYVPRMKQATAALGLDADRLVVILNQFVTLKEGKMSKRAGRFVTLEELIDTVGADAVRYFYLSRSPDTQMEFDLELAVRQNKTNPVYYIQYAHARLCNIEATARARFPDGLTGDAHLDLVVQPWELDVARMIALWPDVVDEAARLLEPHRIPFYLYELADRVSDFYEAGNRDGSFRVVVDDEALTRARLELCRAARACLESGLDIIGVTAPERM